MSLCAHSTAGGCCSRAGQHHLCCCEKGGWGKLYRTAGEIRTAALQGSVPQFAQLLLEQCDDSAVEEQAKN